MSFVQSNGMPSMLHGSYTLLLLGYGIDALCVGFSRGAFRLPHYLPPYEFVLFLRYLLSLATHLASLRSAGFRLSLLPQR